MNQMQNPRLVVEDALSFIQRVKMRCNQRTYKEFLNIMKEFNSGIIDEFQAKERVISLFRGYPDLIEGFNRFLPPCWNIEVESSGQTQTTSVPGSSLLGKNDPPLLDPTNTFGYTPQSAFQTRFTRSNSSLSACPVAEAWDVDQELVTRELFHQCAELLKNEEDLFQELSRILFQP